MSHTVEAVPEQPIVVATCQADFWVAEELDAMVDAILRLAESSPQPVFLIVDMLAVTFSPNDIIIAANRARKDSNSVFHHPAIRQVIFISDSRLVELASRGLNTEIFGNISVRTFPSVEAALKEVHKQLTSTKGSI